MPHKGYKQTSKHKRAVKIALAKPKSRKKMRDSAIGKHLGQKNGMYRRKQTVIAKEKQKQASLKQFKNGMPQKTKNKLRKANSGKNNSMYGKFGKDNPNYGSKRTQKTKDLMSESRSGKKHPMYGKKQTIESNAKRRIKQIYYLQKHHAFKDTSIELKMQNILRENNIKFEKQKLLLKKYIVDIFIKPNIIIECDGDYWHNLPGAQEKDKLRDKNLKMSGYQVLRFWEHYINKNANDCLCQLQKVI